MIELYYLLYLLYRGLTWEPELNTQYDEMIQDAVNLHLPEYDWRLYKAQLWEESKLDPNAKSGKGAVGIAQFMPRTWTEWAPKAGYKRVRRTDPEASIFTGAMYMANMMSKWHWPRSDDDRECLAIASYNVGFSNMLKAQRLAGGATLYADIIAKLPEVPKVRYTETINYVRRTLDYCTDQLVGDM